MDLVHRVATRYVSSQVSLRVPLIRQTTNFSCGAAALLGVLRYWLGEDLGVRDESDLWGKLDVSEENGTEPDRIAAVARKFGLQATYVTEMTERGLREALARGDTVIMLVQAWRDDPVDWAVDWDDGHYVVAVGIDALNVYLMDPSTSGTYAWMSLDELPDRWHDFDENGEPQYGLALIIRG